MNKKLLGCGIAASVVILIVLILVMSLAGSYNKLVGLSQGVDSQWAQVQNVYQRRADLIPNLVATVSGAANFEKSTLTEITEARASVGRVNINPNQAPTQQHMKEFEQAQGRLTSAMSRLLVVSENYPQLRATETFATLQAQLEGTENRITVERQKFNDVTREYNTAVKSFPTVLLAGMMGFESKPYFAAEAGAEKPPAVKFDFNKPAPAH